jgi:hypothetical protein
MDIKSLHQGIKLNPNTGLYNLFTPTFVFNTSVKLNEYTVNESEEMRIDLVFSNMYSIEMSMMSNYYQDIDVILYINNIDNPVNIKEGMILNYPEVDSIYKFRYIAPTTINDVSIIKQLGTPNLPNKTTRKDTSRQNYIENDYSLSPVVLDTPREPVRIENGRFSIGGL